MVLNATPTAATSEQIQGVLTILVDVAKAMFDAVGHVVAMVMANPLLLIPIGVVMAYSIVKLFKYIF